MKEFIIGYLSGISTLIITLIFFIRLLTKSINKKNDIIYFMYHEGQLPIICRIEGLAMLVKFTILKVSNEGVDFDKNEINLLINEIHIFKAHIKKKLNSSSR